MRAWACAAAFQQAVHEPMEAHSDPRLPGERRRLVKDCARSRFGLEVGKQARQTLIRRVQKGDVKYARKLTNSRTVIVLDYAGRRDWHFSTAARPRKLSAFWLPMRRKLPTGAARNPRCWYSSVAAMRPGRGTAE